MHIFIRWYIRIALIEKLFFINLLAVANSCKKFNFRKAGCYNAELGTFFLFLSLTKIDLLWTTFLFPLGFFC
jgi:hypothetical protein